MHSKKLTIVMPNLDDILLAIPPEKGGDLIEAEFTTL